MLDNKKDEYVMLIQKHSGIIHKVIGLYIDNVEDRKDLYQEILLQVWKSLSDFRGNSSFSTWLYKVSLYTVLTFNKKRKNTHITEEIKDADNITGGDEDYEILYRIVKSLDEIDRMMVTLHLEGYKNKEIAEITGITQNHINVKIHRIKKIIKDKFKLINDGQPGK